jgi:hypothetical protein
MRYRQRALTAEAELNDARRKVKLHETGGTVVDEIKRNF